MIPECPGAHGAKTLLRTALEDIGLARTAFNVGVVDTDEAAPAQRFAGSPAFIVEGTDLFSSEEVPGSMACRVYSTPDGPRNVPALRDLRRALKERAAVNMRDGFRRVRRGVIDHNWHRHPLFGRPLRWLGKLVP